VKDGFIKGQQKNYPGTVLGKVSAVSTSAYYDWAKNTEEGGKIAENQKLRERAQALFDASKRSYGSRRLSDGLKKAGFPVGRFKARRVMAELNLRPRYPKRFKATNHSNHNPTIAPNLLERKFNVAKPNQKWTTDITNVLAWGGWHYVPSGA